jgi:uncharacterized protein VcgC/VcgE DUF2780
MKTKKVTVSTAVLSFLLMIFAAGNVCAETSTTMDLIKMLTSQLGVTETQANGGAGALFDMAKGALSETDYSQVASAIPGIGDLIKSAPAVSESTAGTSDTMAGLTKGFGAVTEAVDSANTFAAVTDQFEQLGLDAGMVSQFIPVLLAFAESAGGESVVNILKSVWQ